MFLFSNKRIAFGFFVFLVVGSFVFLFISQLVFAAIVDTDWNWFSGVDCNKDNDIGSCLYTTSSFFDGRLYQFWSADGSLTITFGFGAGAEGEASWCVSDSWLMWVGSCWSTGLLVPFGSSTTVGIGFSDPNNYTSARYYFNLLVYADDSRWTGNYAIHGRHVGTHFTNVPPAPIGQFTVDWVSGHAVRGQEFSASGPISCSPSYSGGGGSANCTPSAEGLAQVRITAYGWNGQGVPEEDSDVRDVYVKPAIACGNGIIDPGEQCDGGNLGGYTTPRESCDIDIATLPN